MTDPDRPQTRARIPREDSRARARKPECLATPRRRPIVVRLLATAGIAAGLLACRSDTVVQSAPVPLLPPTGSR